MTEIQSWSYITISALQNLWRGFISFLPTLIAALIVFVVGWFISVWVGRLIAEILKRIKLDKIFEKNKWQEALEKADLKMRMSEFIGAIIKWMLVIVFLLATVQILGLSAFAGFLTRIVSWLPNLIVATAIFIVAVVIADFAEKVVKAVVGRMGVGYSKLVGAVVKWAVWIFAVLAILLQIGIASQIVQVLVQGFVALLVISSGLAFGLGGKDVAREILESLKNKIKD